MKRRIRRLIPEVRKKSADSVENADVSNGIITGNVDASNGIITGNADELNGIIAGNTDTSNENYNKYNGKQTKE